MTRGELWLKRETTIINHRNIKVGLYLYASVRKLTVNILVEPLARRIRISIKLRDLVFNESAPCGRATIRAPTMRKRHGNTSTRKIPLILIKGFSYLHKWRLYIRLGCPTIPPYRSRHLKRLTISVVQIRDSLSKRDNSLY